MRRTKRNCSQGPDIPYPYLTNKHSEEVRKWTVENFQILRIVYEGVWCDVYKIRQRETEELAFLKVSRKHYQYKTKYLSEAYIWRKASTHPYVSTLYASYYVEKDKYYIFEYFSEGSLRNFIRTHKVLQTKVAVLFAAQMVSAVEFLHSKDIFHREVNNRHIILSDQGQIKLTNFRHALMNKTARGMHGNLYYQAPEVFSGEIYDRTADWYSLGVCLYEMVVGKTPVEYHCKRNQINFAELDVTGKIVVMMTVSVYIPEAFPESLRDILEGFLQEHQEARLGYGGNVKAIKNHRFFGHVDWEEVENGLVKVDLPKEDSKPLIGSLSSVCETRWLSG